MLPFKSNLQRNFLQGGVPRIDWNNPITAGLTACYVASAGQGNLLLNLVGNGGNLTVRNSTTGITSEGMGLSPGAAAGSGGCSATVHNAAKPTVAASVFWRGTITALSSSSLTALMAVNFSNPEGSPFLVYGVYTEQSPAGIVTGSGTSGGFALGATIAYTTSNRVTSVGASFQTGGNQLLYINGKLSDTTAMNTGSFTYSGTSEIDFCGYQGNLNRFMQGTALIGCMWNRVLSPAEMLYLDKSPYGFLNFPTDRIFSTLVGASAGTSFKPYWAMRHSIPFKGQSA